MGRAIDISISWLSKAFEIILYENQVYVKLNDGIDNTMLGEKSGKKTITWTENHEDVMISKMAKEYLLFYFLKGTNILVHVKEYTRRTREEHMTSSLDYNHNEIKKMMKSISCHADFRYCFTFFSSVMVRADS